MKNTVGSNSSGPPEKKLKQGSVLSFFTAASKGRTENTRKRKLSQNDEDIQVLKVRCGDENVEVPKDDLQEPKKEHLAKAADKKAAAVEIVNLENDDSKQSNSTDVAAPVEKVEEKLPAATKEDLKNEPEKPEEAEEKVDDNSDVSNQDQKSDETMEDNESKSASSPSKSENSDLEEMPSINSSLNMSACNNSLLMDICDKDSITSISDIPITPMKDTPKVRKLTPKQIQRQVESQKRREAKEKEKQEKEQQRLQEKLDRQKKRQAEIDQKLEEKKAKEEERRRQEEKKLEDKKRKEEEKLKEKQKREEEKLQEKKKKEDEKLQEKKKREDEKLMKELEKKKADEEAQKKQAKTSAAFVSFFKKPATEQSKAPEEKVVVVNNFMPFTLKKGMRLAPVTRHALEMGDKSAIDEGLQSQAADKLYLQLLKENLVEPKKSGKTFYVDKKDSNDDDEVTVLEDESEDEDDKMGEIVVANNAPDKNTKPPRAKLLQFAENRRPAYWGTWSKKSDSVGPRKPLGIEKMFDYEVDSDDEWEEEEPGESLHGSDDEKESEDEYEVDNDLFVPHGYLSDEEAGNSEDEALPAEEQKERLRQLEMEFQEELKKKVKHLTPRMVTCFNPNDTTKTDDAVHIQVMRILGQFAAVVVTDKILTSFNSEIVDCDNVDEEAGDLNVSVKTEGSTKKNKMKVPDEAVPDFIRLVHGNSKNRHYLIKEFIAYWDKKIHPEIDVESEAEHNRCLISIGNANKVFKEMAVWKACPDEGPLHGRLCWWVSKEHLEKHSLTDLPLPNTWTYTLKPAARRSKTPKAVVKQAEPPKIPDAEPEAPSPEPMVVETPPKSAKENLITKFTKVLTAEERQQQMEAEKQKAKEKKEAEVAKAALNSSPFGPQSAFFIKNSPSTSNATVKTSSPVPTLSSAAASVSPAGEQKKGRRVSLLFSVPRGQNIPSSRPAPSATPSAFNAAVPSTSSKKDDDDGVVQLD